MTVGRCFFVQLLRDQHKLAILSKKKLIIAIFCFFVIVFWICWLGCHSDLSNLVLSFICLTTLCILSCVPCSITVALLLHFVIDNMKSDSYPEISCCNINDLCNLVFIIYFYLTTLHILSCASCSIIVTTLSLHFATGINMYSNS